MSRSPLFIFSFRTLDTASFPRSFWWSVGVFVLCLAVIETGSRMFMGPIGHFSWAYWSSDAINKFEWYRKMSVTGNPPQVVVIGDSTGARDFDPRFFSRTAGKTSYNLAWPANFPRALRATTYPLLEKGHAPGTVLLIQNPGGYVDNQRTIRFENSILSSQIAKQYGKDHLVTDYIYISRLYAARFLLKKYWIDHEEIVLEPDFMGFMPARGENKAAFELKGEREDEPVAGRLSQGRLECFTQLARILDQRGIQLIVVIPPVNTDHTPPVFTKYINWLKSQSRIFTFSLWDFSHAEFLKDEHFYDKGHLNESGAGLFSTQLGRRYQQWNP